MNRTPTVRELYNFSVQKSILSMALEKDIKRAQRILRKLRKDPGDCADFPILLVALAVAEAHNGNKSPGWIPHVQKIAVQLEKAWREQDDRHHPSRIRPFLLQPIRRRNARRVV